MTEDSGLSSLLQRIQWRKAVFAWLKERSQFTDSDLDVCLAKLGENPALREAALAAFWGTYLANELPAALSDSQEEKLRSLLERIPASDCNSKEARDLAFVKLNLAVLLAICVIRPDRPISESPIVADMLEEALATHHLLEESGTVTEIVDDPCGWGHQHFHEDLFTFSVVLLGGIAGAELAFWHLEQRRFEDAFLDITNAAWDIYTTTITLTADVHTDESIRNAFEPYLPHSGGPFSIQETADIFEEVKRHPKSIESWDHIDTGCEAFQFLGKNGAYDLLENITDARGQSFAALEYWGKGATFAQERQLVAESPYPILTRPMIERAETRERLRRDFLRDLWTEMDKNSQEILVDGETQWMHGRPDNMVKDIRPMLELVLPSVFPYLEAETKRSDPEGRHLILTRWRDALRHSAVQARIDKLKLSDPRQN
jgi:hypothetical protein